MKDGWGRVRRIVQLSYILSIATLILAAVTIYSLVSPFNPMHVSGVHMEPETVCPLELVGINGKTDLASGRYHITIDPVWIKSGKGGKVLDEAQVDGDIAGPLNDADSGEELVYVAPPERGDWLIKFDIEIEGRNLILPRTQEFSVTTVNVLHVVDCGDSYEYEEYEKKV
jgi:hypothetical protein